METVSSFYHSGNSLCAYVNLISGIIFGFIDVLPVHVVIFMNLLLMLFFCFLFSKAFLYPKVINFFLLLISF